MSNNLKLRPMKIKIKTWIWAIVLLTNVKLNAQNGTWAPFMNLSGWNTVSTDSVNNQLDITDGSDTIMTFDGTNYGSYTYPYRALGQDVQFIRTSGTVWFLDQNNLYQGETGTYSNTPLLKNVISIALYNNNVFVYGSKLNGSYAVIEYSGIDASIKNHYNMNGIPTGLAFMGMGVYNGIPYISLAPVLSTHYSTYKWNGSSWVFAFNSHAASFAEYNGNLYYQSGSDSISCYNGTSILNTWTFSGGGPIRSLTVFNGSLYVTGVFTSIDGVTCQNSAIYTETPKSTGIESTINNANWFNVYPNPFSDQLNINSDHRTNITISDATGREIVSKVVESGIQNIDLGSLKSGMYILRTSDGLTKKITKP